MNVLGEMSSVLLAPMLASVVFVFIHSYLGIHVLRRNIVFADLALAQLSALGATVAFASMHPANSVEGVCYTLAFTVIGALLLSTARFVSPYISQEAFVGLLYVAATAATILIVDRSPQGAEHVKKILAGNILMVDLQDVFRLAALYGAIGLFYWFARRPLLMVSTQKTPTKNPLRVSAWDFAFFFSFGIVVASSVSTAGVLLVFSFLIGPALIASMFSSELRVALPIAWGSGVVASAAGLTTSYFADLPTGAAIVLSVALTVLVAALAKAVCFVPPQKRMHNLRAAVQVLFAVSLFLIFASGAWLMFNPLGDQPILTFAETVSGLAPTSFFRTGERQAYENASTELVRLNGEMARVNAREKFDRCRTVPLSDDEIRQIASYQQSFNEMIRGEQFVQRVLLNKARMRQRFILGPAFVVLCLLGLVGWVAARRKQRSRIAEPERRAPSSVSC